MTRMKRLSSSSKKTTLGFVLWLIALVLATMAVFAITTPAHAESVVRVPVAKQQHYLYQVQGGYIKQFTVHRDRYSCITTAAKLKLRSGTWECLPY